MSWTPLLLLWSCTGKDPEPTPKGAGACVLETTQYATGVVDRTRHLACGEVQLDDFEVVGEGELTIELFTDGQRIVPALTARGGDAVFRALHMSGHWALEGVTPVRGLTVGPDPGVFELPETIALHPEGYPEPDSPGTSSWAGLVGRISGPAALVGAHSAAQTAFSTAMGADGSLHATWGEPDVAIEVRDGFTLYLDPLFMAVGPSAAEVWQAWVDAVAVSGGVSVRPAPALVAWWPPATDALAVSAAAAVAGSVGGERPIESIGVAEGWDDAWDLSGLAAEITAGGRVAALAIDPFRVRHDDDVYLDNPSWFLTDASGAELEDDGHAILDVGVGDAAEWLEDRVALQMSAGFSWFELHHLQVMPDVVTLRRGLEIVRQGAGGDAYLVAADGPELPMVGLVDGFLGGPMWAQANGVWWTGGSEPLELDGLPEELARGAVVHSVVSGGPRTLGDAVLQPASVDLALAAGLARDDQAPRTPQDLMTHLGVPAIWSVAEDTVALINRSEAALEVHGPGGTEVLTGEAATPGARVLLPNGGELWR